MVPLVWVLYTVVERGFTGDHLRRDGGPSRWQGVLPEQFAGGVYHAIYGTIVQAAIAAVLAVPLGILAAIYLVEYGRGRLPG